MASGIISRPQIKSVILSLSKDQTQLPDNAAAAKIPLIPKKHPLKNPPLSPANSITQKLVTPNDARIFYIRHAMRAGFSNEEIHNLTKIDPWFIAQLRELVDEEDGMSAWAIERDIKNNFPELVPIL